jgi:hypothetical protein
MTQSAQEIHGRKDRCAPKRSSGSGDISRKITILRTRVATEVAPQSWQADPRRRGISIRRCRPGKLPFEARCAPSSSVSGKKGRMRRSTPRIRVAHSIHNFPVTRSYSKPAWGSLDCGWGWSCRWWSWWGRGGAGTWTRSGFRSRSGTWAGIGAWSWFRRGWWSSWLRLSRLRAGRLRILSSNQN